MRNPNDFEIEVNLLTDSFLYEIRKTLDDKTKPLEKRGHDSEAICLGKKNAIYKLNRWMNNAE